MKIEVEARQVTVFVNSTDQYQGHALYAAIVQRCRERGLAGATATRCTEGYGAGRQLHTTRLVELSEDLPMRVDIVDLPERIDPFLEELAGMVGEGLIAVANVRVLRLLTDPSS